MSKKRNVRINQGRVIPLWGRLVISAFLMTCVIYVNLYFQQELAVFLSITLATPVLPLWNVYQILEIDNNAKAFLRGYWVAGLKFGKWKRYERIIEIKILGPRSGNILIGSGRKSYEAFLLLEPIDQVYLLGNNSSEKLKDLLKDIYDKLDLKHNN